MKWGECVSPDGKRKAYRERIGNKCYVVVDGIRSKAYEDAGLNPPVFSPDSKRVACSMLQGGKQFIVVDGKEGPKFDEIVDGLVTSSLVTKGVFEEQHGIVFSPDSKRLVYVAWLGRNAMVVVDGKKGKPYDQIGRIGIFFSPDSKHIAYAASKNSKWFVVVDGREGDRYDGIGQAGITYELNTSIVRYRALLNGEWITVDQRVGR